MNKLKKIITHHLACDPSGRTSYERRYDECVLIGSGPSISRLNTSSDFFDNKDIFTCNFVPLSHTFKTINIQANFMIDIAYTKRIDDALLTRASYNIFSVKNAHFLPFDVIINKKTVIYRTLPFHETVTDFDNFLYTGNVMPFMIQLCIKFGYKKINLCGVDHYDKTNLIQKNFNGYKGSEIQREFDLKKVEYIEAFYNSIATHGEVNNVKIINTFTGSFLDSFKKIEPFGLYQD